jgi:hypothetical protein
VRAGDFNYEYLPGFRRGRTRMTPTLETLARQLRCLC